MLPLRISLIRVWTAHPRKGPDSVPGTPNSSRMRIHVCDEPRARTRPAIRAWGTVAEFREHPAGGGLLQPRRRGPSEITIPSSGGPGSCEQLRSDLVQPPADQVGKPPAAARPAPRWGADEQAERPRNLLVLLAYENRIEHLPGSHTSLRGPVPPVVEHLPAAVCCRGRASTAHCTCYLPRGAEISLLDANGPGITVCPRQGADEAGRPGRTGEGQAISLGCGQPPRGTARFGRSTRRPNRGACRDRPRAPVRPRPARWRRRPGTARLGRQVPRLRAR
jgi:hypothetical protein